MKRKTIFSVAAVAFLIAATLATMAISSKSNQNSGATIISESMEEAEKNAAFNMEYPDRLGGIPATGFKSNGGMIEVQYGETNYVRKKFGMAEGTINKAGYDEISEQEVNGVTVTLNGKGGLIYTAAWNDNNFEYVICTETGVAADEMIEYIEATR